MNETLQASLKIVKDILKVKEGETVVITVDSEGDWEFALNIEQAVNHTGAKSLILRNWAPPHVGHAADPYLPLEAMKQAVSHSDVWVELNNKWLLYSSVHEEALRAGRTRHLCLVGMNREMAVRCIGRVDVAGVLEFEKALVRLTAKAKNMRYTTPAGTNVTFENDPSRPIRAAGLVTGPGSYMLIGQVGWNPIDETIDGYIVFDGSVSPPLGLLKSPIKLKVNQGRVVDISGGPEAKLYSDWLKSFKDENMYRLAHVCYGCNPGAKLTGNVVEDERIWGCLEWGLGYRRPNLNVKEIIAASHSDGITLKPTLYADGELVIKDGEYVHPELKPLADKLKPAN